ncbi:hypothetical protein EDB85DRAFT_2002403 [Lactarius pseudohatsudake]|nr:hypothetical protein EDB85DRAFT_2002403 [Lactarius pseudohatsudake]
MYGHPAQPLLALMALTSCCCAVHVTLDTHHPAIHHEQSQMIGFFAAKRRRLRSCAMCSREDKRRIGLEETVYSTLES